MPVFSIPSWEVTEEIVEYLEDVSDLSDLSSSILLKINAILTRIQGTPRRDGVFPIFLDITDDEAEQFETAISFLEENRADSDDRLGITSSYWGD